MPAEDISAQGLIFVSELGRLPVSNMFDIDGDDTDDPALAFTVVCPLPDGKWLSAWVYEGEIIDPTFRPA